VHLLVCLGRSSLHRIRFSFPPQGKPPLVLEIAVAVTFTTELRVPPNAAFSSLVESFASDAARRAELDDAQQQGLVAAAQRAFGMAIEDGLGAESEPIRFVASCTPIHLALSLFERGLPMDDAFARRDSAWSALADDVDTVHWHSHGTAGSELRLGIERLHGVLRADASAITGEDDVPLAPEQEYVIRRFVPDDASGVARAFYLTYGYAYDLCAVYVPSRLVELNESGRYVSIIAVTNDGDVVGHYALARDGDAPIADACGAIVLPAHRGRDLLNRLREQAEREAVALGLAAYYSEPVTDHPRTQHASETFGAKACGITLGEAPRTFIARHMELTATAQRQSCMLYVKPLQPRESRSIFAPARHRALVARIYEQLGLPVFVTNGLPLEGRGLFHTTITRRDAMATVEVDAIGSETAELVRQVVADLRSIQRLGAIYISLPLEDPGTPALCEAMEACGFFFSGVGPWMNEGRDALRLQMPLTPIDLSALVVIGEFGNVLLDYIASERERCAGGTIEIRASMATGKLTDRAM
jgi:hypothetical protein